MPSTTATFNGYFPSDFVQPTGHGEKDSMKWQEGRVLVADPKHPTPQVEAKFECSDGREFHGKTVTRENAHESFKQRGFTLLRHSTKCSSWNEDYLRGMINPFVRNDVYNLYAKEVEEIIRNVLLKDYNVISVEGFRAVLKRGPGSKNNFYGTGVHQDYGQSYTDYAENLEAFGGSYLKDAWETSFAKEEVEGFIMINFWRPIEMEEPLWDKPLACLDPNSVQASDLVPTGLDASAVHGKPGMLTNQQALRYNPQHKWYYYPRMTNDEVLIMKQFEFWKGEDDDRSKLPVRSVFHSAFEDPAAPADAPKRTSTEYRVPVFVGKRKSPEEVRSASQVSVQGKKPSVDSQEHVCDACIVA